jgi:hypothetical protein
MKNNTKKDNSKKPVANTRGAQENHAVAPDPKEQLRQLQEQMRALREEAKRTAQIHIAARSEQRMEVVERWLNTYKTRRANAVQRIAKIDEAIETLEARKQKLMEAQGEKDQQKKVA